MAAFNYFQPADATGEITDYIRKTYGIAVYAATTGTLGLGQGPIPYVTRYSPSGSVAFLYIQTDRTLVTSGAMTTAANYTITRIAGSGSIPTVTAVAFTNGKKHIRLTLSGTLSAGSQYVLSVASSTFTDGVDTVFNVTGAVPIYVDDEPTQSGIDQTIGVGTPVMS